MSGPDDVTVVWVEKAEGRDDAVRSMNDWARARGVRLKAPDAAAPASAALRVDPSVAERVEGELDQAREAITALDAEAAERALARAETLVREHPELPQAAWLRAEVSRSWAARFARVDPRDDARAAAAGQEADALDGGRAMGIGEAGFPARPRITTSLTVSGGGQLSVRLDGVELACTSTPEGLSCPVDVAPAEHHVVVAVDGDAVQASWVTIAPLPPATARPPLSIALAEDGACSVAAFRAVRRDAQTVRADRVSCPSWVAAAPAEGRSAVLVARCEGPRCGPFVEWRSRGGLGGDPGDASEAPPPVVARSKWPAWATWTAVGVGAAVATTITLIATGAFESRATEPRFTAGGVRIE
ncbi:MAG: hypothetical protein JWP97_929 [Labilithrix sp.]|nr:hypothetical protein [Labilithrix sp.]